MFATNKILCPTDFSEGSLQAFAVATDLALTSGGELYLVHVLSGRPAAVEADIEVNLPDFERDLREAAEEKMRELAAPLAARGLRARFIVSSGDPADVIVRLARDAGADLIVIATHGETGWRHLAFGSVTEKVVRLAACPVLTIRMGATQRAATSAA